MKPRQKNLFFIGFYAGRNGGGRGEGGLSSKMIFLFVKDHLDIHHHLSVVILPNQCYLRLLTQIVTAGIFIYNFQI